MFPDNRVSGKDYPTYSFWAIGLWFQWLRFKKKKIGWSAWIVISTAEILKKIIGWSAVNILGTTSYPLKKPRNGVMTFLISSKGGYNCGMSRQEVRDAARMRIGDTGLIDYILKSVRCWWTRCLSRCEPANSCVGVHYWRGLWEWSCCSSWSRIEFGPAFIGAATGYNAWDWCLLKYCILVQQCVFGILELRMGWAGGWKSSR